MELAPGLFTCPRFTIEDKVSILVFVELAPGHDDDEVVVVVYVFQSLFLWNSRPDGSRHLPQQRGMGVSILVFVELAPGHRCRVNAFQPPAVSILVFVELAPGPGAGASTGASSRRLVSILVFVELAPGHQAGIAAKSWLESFQSLFLWNSRPDIWFDGYLRFGEVFQSLFLWNSRPDRAVQLDLAEEEAVSILVFVELAPGPKDEVMRDG